MVDIKLSVLPCEKCKREMIAFRNANREAQRSEADFEWRYLKRPNGAQPLIVWAEIAKEKVGALSLIPHNYLVDNKSLHLGVLGDISVAKKYRGKGVAKKMFTFLAGLDEFRGMKVSIVLPNKDASIPLERAGWATVSKINRYVKILNVRGVLNKKKRQGMLTSLIAPFLDFLLRLSPYELLFRIRPRYEWELVDGFDSRFDELWDSLNKAGMIIGTRDKKYLTWRYSSHPLVKFRIFTLVDNSKLSGYIVFHIKDGTCYIDDFLCLQEDNAVSYLLFHFINLARKENLSEAIVLKTNSNDLLILPLRKFGFVRRRDYQQFMIHATASGPEELKFFMNGAKWFLTAGDKDV